MAFDAVVAHPSRLEILTALAPSGREEFVAVRKSTQLTDGNLSCHASRLANAGYIRVEKQFRSGKPGTVYVLTSQGRAALDSHVRRILHATTSAPTPVETAETEEPWVD